MISNRAQKIPTSAALDINARCNSLLKQGKDIVKFAIGESDFHAPENVNAAALKAVKENACHYTAANGTPEIKEAICLKFKRENRISYANDEVIASAGGKGVIWAALQAVLDPKDEVLTPLPYYLSYPPLISLAGASMKTINAKEDDNFELKSDLITEKITKKTKAFMFCNPCNPTGAVNSKAELKRIADILIEHKIYCISDEVYDNLVYDGECISIASINNEIKDLTITVNAASKTYSVSGWRLGYGGASREVIQAMSSIQSHESGNPNSIAQKAIIEAIRGPQDSVIAMRNEFKKRRDFIVKRVNEIKGMHCITPKGAFYLFPNISSIFNSKIKNATEFCNILLDNYGVGAIPGEPMGSKNHFRITYASPIPELEKGMDRIDKCVKKITQS